MAFKLQKAAIQIIRIIVQDIMEKKMTAQKIIK